MIERKSWEEFRNAGLLWWINMILHTFGWAITVELKDGKIIDCYPARVKFARPEKFFRKSKNSSR